MFESELSNVKRTPSSLRCTLTCVGRNLRVAGQGKIVEWFACARVVGAASKANVAVVVGGGEAKPVCDRIWNLSPRVGTEGGN